MSSEKIKLFCLPFAGGSKYSFSGFSKFNFDKIDICPLEAPGRGDRHKENLLTDLNSIVKDIFCQVCHNLETPYAIYGHSMGGITGYLLTKKIIENNLPHPQHLFVSGSRAPSVPRIRKLSSLSKSEFYHSVKDLGGLPQELILEKSLFDYFEGILRSDFEALENYQYTSTTPFDIPITIMTGKEDSISYEEAIGWSEETTRNTEVVEFPGKHFFILHSERDILSLIWRKLSNNRNGIH